MTEKTIKNPDRSIFDIAYFIILTNLSVVIILSIYVARMMSYCFEKNLWAYTILSILTIVIMIFLINSIHNKMKETFARGLQNSGDSEPLFAGFTRISLFTFLLIVFFIFGEYFAEVPIFANILEFLEGISISFPFYMKLQIILLELVMFLFNNPLLLIGLLIAVILLLRYLGTILTLLNQLRLFYLVSFAISLMWFLLKGGSYLFYAFYIDLRIHF